VPQEQRIASRRETLGRNGEAECAMAWVDAQLIEIGSGYCI
jgi:hypothetical protein